MMRLAVWAVMLSAALMPGTVRASVVHLHDHGRHEHQQPLFLPTPAGDGHHHHHDNHADHADHADQGHETSSHEHREGMRVLDQDIIGQSLQSPSLDPTSAFIAIAPGFAASHCRNDSDFPRIWQASPPCEHTSARCVLRLVQTSHALLL